MKAMVRELIYSVSSFVTPEKNWVDSCETFHMKLCKKLSWSSRFIVIIVRVEQMRHVGGVKTIVVNLRSGPKS